MTTQERSVEPAMDSSPSPYLSLRQAVRPAIFAHFLLAEDQERARQLAAECEDLLFLTRELLKAAGLASILGAGSLGADPLGAGLGSGQLDEDGGDRQAQLLGAYAEAGLLWAKVVGSTMALARALLDQGDWDGVGRLASFLADAGEDSPAAELKIQLGKAVWGTYRDLLQDISNTMPPEAISSAIDALRAVLLKVPEDVPDRNREVNRFLAPLAASVHAIMRDQGIDIPYSSRVEHIATGGVARHPDIVKLSLDEIAAEFEGTVTGLVTNKTGEACPGLSTILTRWRSSGPTSSSSTGTWRRTSRRSGATGVSSGRSGGTTCTGCSARRLMRSRQASRCTWRPPKATRRISPP
jgi:hypothetical protein